MTEKPKNPFVHPAVNMYGQTEQSMTLLDYFAGQVLKANIDDITWQSMRLQDKSSKESLASYVAKYSYDIADEMLKERERRGI